MSDSHLIYNSKETENTVNILYHLFKIFGDKEYVIRGWNKKVLGYGLRQAWFEQYTKKEFPTNEKRFRDYKQKLLDRQFIEVYDKTNRVKGGPFYIITPLGLLFLLKYIDSPSKNTITDIFKRLDFTRLNDPRMSFDTSVWEFFTIKQIHKAISVLADNIGFRFDENDNEIFMDITLTKSKNKVRVFESRFNKMDLIITKSYWNLLEDKDTHESIKVEMDKFYWEISFYFTLLLVYYLFENLQNKEVLDKMPFPFRRFVDTIWSITHDELGYSMMDISEESIILGGFRD